MVDPVCGRELGDGGARVSVVFRGKRWFFCADPACRLAFKRAPERWAEARPEAGVAARPPGPPPPRRAPSPFHVVSVGGEEVDRDPASPNDSEDPRHVAVEAAQDGADAGARSPGDAAARGRGGDSDSEEAS